jgi:succinoglycan biosynthesis protein ExoM
MFVGKGRGVSKKTKIDICVATYRRPGLLGALLRSLARQKLGGLRARVVVVDNDPAGSARAVVADFRRKASLPVLYAQEPIQGISYARNRALDLARAPYIAFLDDDETAHPDWLRLLWECLEQYGADAVFGRVRRLVPPHAPDWAAGHYLIHPPRFTTGQRVTVGPTNNVLVRAACLGDPPLRFDPAFALTGGSDSDFFYRLHLSGKKLIRCAEAVVEDHWLPERLTVGWICRRGWRAGQSYTRVFVSRRSLAGKAVWTLSCLALMSGGALALPWVWLVSRPASVGLLTRVCYYAGKLSVLFGSGLYFQEYAAHRASVESARA